MKSTAVVENVDRRLELSISLISFFVGEFENKRWLAFLVIVSFWCKGDDDDDDDDVVVAVRF